MCVFVCACEGRANDIIGVIGKEESQRTLRTFVYVIDFFFLDR